MAISQPRAKIRHVLGAILSLGLISSVASAREAMTYRWALASGTSEELEAYAESVLTTALDRTRQHYGDYDISIVRTMERKRIILEMERGSPSVNAAVFPLDGLLDATLLPVRIPVDRGILGLRILLVRAGDEDRMGEHRSLESLGALRIGVIPSWAEARIVRYNGLNAIDGASLGGLWKMLERGRVDALDRSALEAGAELARYRDEAPSAVLDRHVALYGPLPSYFWFSRSAGGRLLAQRVRAGLELMVADGSLDALFHQYFDQTLRDLEMEHRTMIYLENPYIGPEDPVTDRRYWLFSKRD